MKKIHLAGSLILGGILLACESTNLYNEDEKIIITDKGLDLDDDKTHQIPADGNTSTTPGTGEELPPVMDTIPPIIQEEEPKEIPQAGMDTLFINNHQTDTTLFVNKNGVIDSHISIQSKGNLIITKDWEMKDEATITIKNEGYLSVLGKISRVDITIQSGGTLDIYRDGSILLKSKEDLYIEQGAIIKCNGSWMYNDGLKIYAPSTDDSSSALEKIDSIRIEEMIIYGPQ